MRPSRRTYSSDATSFIESNRRRMHAFWKAPAVFTLLMTAAAWISWLLGSGTVSALRFGTVQLYIPVGPERPLILADVVAMPVGFLLHALFMAMPVFMGCLAFLFPIRLADGNTFISRPIFWRIYVSTLGAIAGLCTFVFYARSGEPVQLVPTLENAPMVAVIAVLFAAVHLLAGHIGARWLIWSSGLFDARRIKDF
ncbi:hypothetical protein [Henriciella sp.]|uniref:hypothetical protein n=1 Tax=Henriciella sp. TaxID=1968823 RepID=UPI0026330EA4|nr:hypothetical protein [Henriciella sp.]